MISAVAGIAIVVFGLVAAGVVGWLVISQLRARRLGQPARSLSSYLPWNKRYNPYGPPQPAPGGAVGWINDRVRRFKNRNNRPAAGAYEPSNRGLGGAGGAHRALDPDEAWDMRVDNEADSYGYYEEELATRDFASSRNNTEYHGAMGGVGQDGGSYDRKLVAGGQRRHGDGDGAVDDDDEAGLDRGRQPSRSPGGGAARNPFDDEHAESLRGVSPRPMESERRGGGSPSRRSMFRENV